MGEDYSYVGAVAGATYPEMGAVLRKIMPKSYILVPGYGAQEERARICFLSSMKTVWVQSSIPPEGSSPLISRKNMPISQKPTTRMLPGRPCLI